MFVVLPTIGWVWPSVVPLVAGVASALGYKMLSAPKGRLRGKLTRQLENIRREVVPLDSVLAEVIAGEVGEEERLIFQRDDFLLVFRKDARGKFYVEVSGPAEKTALDLKLRAEAFARELVRKFAYHKIAEQLTRRGAVVVEEDIMPSGRVTMKVRTWK